MKDFPVPDYDNSILSVAASVLNIMAQIPTVI
jgi:hypothetical protein